MAPQRRSTRQWVTARLPPSTTARLKRLEQRRIPDQFDYVKVLGLSNEARARLMQRRPLTLGEASRVAGVRQADVQLLLVVLSR